MRGESSTGFARPTVPDSAGRAAKSRSYPAGARRAAAETPPGMRSAPAPSSGRPARSADDSASNTFASAASSADAPPPVESPSMSASGRRA